MKIQGKPKESRDYGVTVTQLKCPNCLRPTEICQSLFVNREVITVCHSCKQKFIVLLEVEHHYTTKYAKIENY